MKRYIRSASYRRRELPRYQEWIKALKQDIRNVAACRNEEDLANLEIKSWNSNSEKHIWNSRFEKMGVTDFDEKIDLIIDWLYDSVKYAKETSDTYTNEISTADEVQSKIRNYLAQHDYYFDEFDSMFIVRPEDLSRDALINFIDDLISTLGGRYHGTGRGGSWTAWNIMIDGIEYQIGPTDSREAWEIREV